MLIPKSAATIEKCSIELRDENLTHGLVPRIRSSTIIVDSPKVSAAWSCKARISATVFNPGRYPSKRIVFIMGS